MDSPASTGVLCKRRNPFGDQSQSASKSLKWEHVTIHVPSSSSDIRLGSNVASHALSTGAFNLPSDQNPHYISSSPQTPPAPVPSPFTLAQNIDSPWNRPIQTHGSQFPPGAGSQLSMGMSHAMDPFGAAPTTEATCRACSQYTVTTPCTYCEADTCEAHAAQCDKCLDVFCTFCSGVNYDERYERTYCHQCNSDVKRAAAASSAATSIVSHLPLSTAVPNVSIGDIHAVPARTNTTPPSSLSTSPSLHRFLT